MAIKYLVISGGGPGGLGMYGIYKLLCNSKFINTSELAKIYSTSCGCFLALIILLNIEWDIIDDYLIKRPWERVFNIHAENIFNIFNTKGILNYKTIKEIIDPLLTYKNLSSNITLKEFYDYSKIEFHLYSVVVSRELPELVDLSYKNYPDLELYKAMCMTSAIPIVFEPIFYNNECYIDGGFLNNFPISYAINDLKLQLNESYNEQEILGIKNIYNSGDQVFSNETSFLSFISNLFFKLHKYIESTTERDLIKNIICYKDERNNIQNWGESVQSADIRSEMIKMGEKIALEFIEQLDSKNP